MKNFDSEINEIERLFGANVAQQVKNCVNENTSAICPDEYDDEIGMCGHMDEFNHPDVNCINIAEFGMQK